MAFEVYNESQLVELLSENFSPSHEITDPDRLIGRSSYLTQIRRALHSPGRHVFIFGERGVGKTSIAVTAGKIAVEEHDAFLYVPCGEDTTFFEVFQSIGRKVLSPAEALGQTKSIGGGLNIPSMVGAHYTTNKASPNLLPTSFGECLDVLRFVKSHYRGQVVIAIDELDRIKSPDDRRRFAEIVKNSSSVIPDIRFILCGIGANVDEIIGEHLSTGRMFEPIDVKRLNYSELWQIIERPANAIGVKIPQGHLNRIAKISDGFPHYVHLIGECLFYAMLDEEQVIEQATDAIFLIALKQALQKAEPSIRKIYQIATEKSNAKLEYEETLWALADRTSDRRQIKDIYENSYLRIKTQHDRIMNLKDENGKSIVRPTLKKEKLNQRLLAMKKDSHANIITGYGSGFFSFRENVVRGYARLKAETVGIELVPEVLT